MALVGLTLAVADPDRATAFYRAVLGWSPPTVRDAVWPGARLVVGGPQAADEARDPFGLPYAVVVGSPAAQGFSAVLYVPDPALAAEFYGALGVDVEVVGGRGRPGVVAAYEVDDVRVAADRVRAAGGTATDTGLCTDDQGLSFYLRAGGPAA